MILMTCLNNCVNGRSKWRWWYCCVYLVNFVFLSRTPGVGGWSWDPDHNTYLHLYHHRPVIDNHILHYRISVENLISQMRLKVYISMLPSTIIKWVFYISHYHFFKILFGLNYWKIIFIFADSRISGNWPNVLCTQSCSSSGRYSFNSGSRRWKSLLTFNECKALKETVVWCPSHAGPWDIIWCVYRQNFIPCFLFLTI